MRTLKLSAHVIESAAWNVASRLISTKVRFIDVVLLPSACFDSFHLPSVSIDLE